jgi:hypothetical protein
MKMAKLRYQIRKMLCYTLYCTTVVLVRLLQSSALSHSTVCTRSVAGVGVALPLGDDHGLEVLALGHLGLDLLDVLGEVGVVLRPLAYVSFPGIRRFDVHPRPWSTPPWARADGSWTTAIS